jgi:hypothetical protein
VGEVATAKKASKHVVKPAKRVKEPVSSADTYTPPGLDIVMCPRQINTFDGFVVSGRAWGSNLEGAKVEVTLATTTRHGVVTDGLWSVRFEKDAMHRRHAGMRPLTVRITDNVANSAQSSEWVSIDEFIDGFVELDSWHSIEAAGEGMSVLVTSGELGLGTHIDGRGLEVILLDEDGKVVADGAVKPGWAYGEWQARFSLVGIPAGQYRIRVALTDIACHSLTRSSLGRPIEIGTPALV